MRAGQALPRTQLPSSRLTITQTSCTVVRLLARPPAGVLLRVQELAAGPLGHAAVVGVAAGGQKAD